MYPTFRLSRIEEPRATAWSVAVLIFASILFSVWALSAPPIAERMALGDADVSPGVGYFVADHANARVIRR